MTILINPLAIRRRDAMKEFFARIATRARIWALAIISSLTVASCGKAIDTAEWSEEVKLADGRLEVVWRQARANRSGFPTASRGSNIDSELRYAPLSVVWKGDWSRIPVSFEIVDGTVYMVLLVMDRQSCAQRAATDYSADFVKWDGRAWLNVPSANFPLDRASINLSQAYWGNQASGDYHGLIRWQSKELDGADRHNNPSSVRMYLESNRKFCRDYQG